MKRIWKSDSHDPRTFRTFPAFTVLALLHIAVYGVVVWLAVTGGPAFQVEIFRDYADRIFSGLTPYSDFDHEYPPTSLIILILPRFFTDDPTVYAALFGLEILAFDLLILSLMAKFGLRALLVYGVGMLLFWRVPFIRHDLVPVAVATLGAFALLRGRYLLSAFLWGFGGALKLYPVVAVPALAFGATLKQTFVRWTLAGAFFIVGLTWGIVAFGTESLMFLTYHSERPAQVESFAGNIQFFLPDARIINTFGSFNVVGYGGDVLVTATSVLQLGLVVFALGVAFLHGRGSDEMGWRMAAVRGAALATFAFAVFGKVFAWHYLFWPLPLLAMSYALVGLRFPKWTWGMYFAAILLTTAINEQYAALTENLPYYLSMLTARNLLLLLIFWLLLLRPPGTREDVEQESGHTQPH